MQKRLFVTVILASSALLVKAQDQLDSAVVHRDTTRHDTVIRRHSFFPLPAAAYSQEKGLEVGAVMLYSFYTDNRNPSALTRNSSINLIPSITTKSQYKIDLRSDIWTHENLWHFKGNLRYHDFPIYFYGIGDATHKADQSLLNNKRYKAQFEGERRITGNFYAGLSVTYQHDTYDSKDNKGLYTTMPLVDKEGGYVTFLGATAIYDNRDNQNYTTRGMWWRFNIAYAPTFLSKQELWKLDLQGRQFFPISRKSTIGLNFNFNSIQGNDGQIPFYLLSEMGSDVLMRGYYAGRYRDKNYVALQAEYRYFLDPKIPINIWFVHMQPKFALAAFGGTGSVFSNSAINSFKPNYGAGIRWFYDEGARLTVRIDYGWGEKRPGEKRQSGLYLSLAEAF